MKRMRQYTISKEMAELTGKMNRSETLRKALRAVFEDPKVLLLALEKRLLAGYSIEETVTVGVSAEDEDVARLVDLSKKTGLHAEQIVRLALEHHLKLT